VLLLRNIFTSGLNYISIFALNKIIMKIFIYYFNKKANSTNQDFYENFYSNLILIFRNIFEKIELFVKPN